MVITKELWDEFIQRFEGRVIEWDKTKDYVSQWSNAQVLALLDIDAECSFAVDQYIVFYANVINTLGAVYLDVVGSLQTNFTVGVYSDIANKLLNNGYYGKD